MHALELERFLVELRRASVALVFPARDVRELLVVTLGFPVLRLAFLAEVPAAALTAMERVDRHQLAELQEVGHAAGLFELRIEEVRLARDLHVLPELLAELRDLDERLLEPGLVARH